METVNFISVAVTSQTALAIFCVWHSYRKGYKLGRDHNRSRRIKDYNAGKNAGYSCSTKTAEEYLNEEK